MGLFKKKISAFEFGGGLMSMIHKTVGQDILRAAAKINDGFQLGDTLIPQFEAKGVTKEQLQSYLCYGFHGTIHIISLPFDLSTRAEIVSGAMSVFANAAYGYSYEEVFIVIEGLLQGTKENVTPELAPYDCDNALIPFLPDRYKKSGVKFSKALLAASRSLNLNVVSVDDSAFDFEIFVSANAVAIAAAQRGLIILEKDFRIKSSN